MRHRRYVFWSCPSHTRDLGYTRTLCTKDRCLKLCAENLRKDLELELLRRILTKLEPLSKPSPTAAPDASREHDDMRELLLLLELSRASRESAGETKRQVEEDVKSYVDWARLLPLLLATGIVLGVIIAQLLGLDMRHAL